MTQRVVITKGIGFYLTPLAMYEYYKLKGIDIFIYEKKLDYRDRKKQKDFFTYMQRLTLNQILKNNFKDNSGGFYAFTKNHGYKVMDDYNDTMFNQDSWLYEGFNSIESRMDKDLIAVCDKLGRNATFEEHKICEIPDGIVLELNEGEAGGEWISEVHRTWF